MIVCSWNINSVRMRENLLFELINSLNPDVIFLQEIKCQNSEFPSIDRINKYNLVIKGENENSIDQWNYRSRWFLSY